MKFAAVLRLAFICVSLLPVASNRGAGAENPHDFAKWESEISAFERIDRTNPPPRDGVLFIGSSTIRLWSTLSSDFPEYQVINRGFGGSEIVDSTHFAERIIFPYQPRLIVLRAGGNDLNNGKSPEAVFADFQEFATTIHARLPRTRIFYISVSPSIARTNLLEKETSLNKLIASYAKQVPHVRFLDTSDIPLDSDGRLRPELFSDRLHFNAEGYELLAARVRPYLTSTPRKGWEPLGLSGGGGMFTPAISPVDPDLMMINCDMSAAYLSLDGGRNWRMIHQAQLRSDTECRPAFHPTDRNIIFASSGGQLRVSHDCGWTFIPIGNLKEHLRGEIAIDPSDPNRMLAGTAKGSCWFSRDAGLTWSVCSGPAGKPIHFCFDGTSNRTTLFAATDQGIWRSDDAGLTWLEKTKGLPWKQIQGFAGGSDRASNLVMLYCSIRSKKENGSFKGGIYRSRDRGESWESAMGKGLNTNTTPGDQWAYGPISQYHQLLTTDAKPLTVYAMNTATGFHPPHFDTVYRSDDGGLAWRPTYYMDPRFKDYNVSPDYVTGSTGQSFKGGETPFGVAICNRDPDRVLMVRNECHVTQNGGSNWFCGSTYPAPSQQPAPGSAWACNGLVVTTTWNYYVDPFESNRHYICYTDLGWARSLDAGESWIWWDSKTWAPWRNTCYELAFDPETSGKIWGAFSDVHDIPNDNIISERHGNKYPGGVCVSTNFGASWKSAADGLPRKAVTSVVVDPKSPNGSRTLYASVFESGVYKSSDDGKTWVPKVKGLGDPKNMRVYRVTLHSSGKLFAIICAKRAAAGKPFLSEGVGLYRSSDSAESWEKINDSQPLLYPKDFSVDPSDSNRILIGACDTSWEDQQGGLYLTENGGKSWQRIGREGAQTFGGYFHPKHRDWIYMTLTEGAPGAGLWLSKDNGKKWTAFDGLPFSNVQRVVFDPVDVDRLYLTTFGGSIWRGPGDPMLEH